MPPVPSTDDAVARGWVELADRVFVRRYAFYDQNIGVVLGDGEALVIDTRSTYPQAREIAAHLRGLTSFPVTVIVNSHGHFDHAFGNRIFRPATIWGHEGCVRFMEQTGEARKSAIAASEPDLAGDLGEVQVDPPDRTFADATTVTVGGRSVDLHFLGRGHTDHDIATAVPGTGVVFGGDLVESGAVPFYGDGYPLEWPATAAALAALVDTAHGVLVPGHGDHAGRAFADAQAASIGRLADLASKVHAGNLRLDEAVAAHPFNELPPDDARDAFDRALRHLRWEATGAPGYARPFVG
jgi:glyoxylase-like metal-dependent hydrolase (beta-lactamase superfamily II)